MEVEVFEREYDLSVISTSIPREYKGRRFGPFPDPQNDSVETPMNEIEGLRVRYEYGTLILSTTV